MQNELLHLLQVRALMHTWFLVKQESVHTSLNPNEMVALLVMVNVRSTDLLEYVHMLWPLLKILEKFQT